jgi:hypothetical protein
MSIIFSNEVIPNFTQKKTTASAAVFLEGDDPRNNSYSDHHKTGT